MYNKVYLIKTTSKHLNIKIVQILKKKMPWMSWFFITFFKLVVFVSPLLFKQKHTLKTVRLIIQYYVKSVRVQSYSCPYFPEFGLNTERHEVSLHIQSECGKIRTRITPNTDTFRQCNTLLRHS